jgi:ribosomal protein S18 acetylase RimI-like enzyme
MMLVGLIVLASSSGWLPSAARRMLYPMPRVQMAAATLDFQGATAESLSEVATFFVDSFWLASTTFGDGVKLSSGERNQLVRKVTEDLGSRYGLRREKRPSNLSGRETPSLFWNDLILARDEKSGKLVGCVGIEASLFDPSTGAVLRSEQADRLVRTELDAMTDAESEQAQAVFGESGIGALAAFVLQRDEGLLVQKFANTYAPYALLANLAVSPSYRGQGLGRELCDFCELCCQDMDDVLLQVEEKNGAARKLYEGRGYKPIYRTEGASSLRLAPSTNPMSAFLPIENQSLLREEPTTLVTMAKRVEGR